MLSDVAALATAAGVFAAVVQLILSRKQARASFEYEFIKRYWAINDDALYQPTIQGGAVERDRYLRLCEDEFEVMRLGSTSWRTWEVWHEAIRDGAAKYRDHLAGYDWLRTCMEDGDHPGSDCDGIFRSSPGVHSQHISARWPSSVGRLWFTAASAVRRTVYVRGGRIARGAKRR